MGMALARWKDDRRADRVPVRLVSAHDGDYPLMLVNLSTTGMLLSSPRALNVGDNVRVELPEIGSTVAQVVWSDTDEYGCQFLEPIPESVVWAVDEVSRRNRSRQQRPVPRRERGAPRSAASDARMLVFFLLFLAVIVAAFIAARELLGS